MWRREERERERRMDMYMVKKSGHFFSPDTTATFLCKLFESDNTWNCELWKRDRITIDTHIVMNNFQRIHNQRILSMRHNIYKMFAII
jgi:hypothetical protein